MYRVYVHYLEQPHECRSAVGKRPFHTRFRVWVVVIVGEPIVTEM
jgi:hypothetical protein